MRKKNKLRLLHYHIHANMYPLDNQKGHTELHREQLFRAHFSEQE